MCDVLTWMSLTYSLLYNYFQKFFTVLYCQVVFITGLQLIHQYRCLHYPRGKMSLLESTRDFTTGTPTNAIDFTAVPVNVHHWKQMWKSQSLNRNSIHSPMKTVPIINKNIVQRKWWYTITTLIQDPFFLTTRRNFDTYIISDVYS